MFLALYLAVLTGGVLAVGLSGLLDFTPESVILLILCGATAAAMLALYIHLIRRNGLSLGGLGFRRFRPRMLHLIWQIPSAIVASACLQGVFLAALTNLGVDSTSAGSSNDTFARIADLPTPFVVLGFVVVAVLTPLWEEVLFRGPSSAAFPGATGPSGRSCCRQRCLLLATWFCSPFHTSSPWASHWPSSDGSIRTYGRRCFSMP